MTNPYHSLEDRHFWKKSVAEVPADAIRPVSGKTFTLDRSDKLSTAGSCFAQNVAKFLRAKASVDFVESEPLGINDPVFSGRYGNIYTARQLLQLFDETMLGLADPDCAIQRKDGRYVDINRPFMQGDGFESPEAVRAARQDHIVAIRKVFTQADIFVFTLGLTEAWVHPETGKTYPVCPGIYADDPAAAYSFKNFSFSEVLADMEAFLDKLVEVNRGVKVLLTVSPVPLTASYSDDHILTATMYSKSILRTVCGELTSTRDEVYYFPSFEIIANPYTAGSAYDDNLRTVRPDVIETVMEFFEAEFMRVPPAASAHGDAAVALGEIPDDVICDDVEIENSMGF